LNFEIQISSVKRPLGEALASYSVTSVVVIIYLRYELTNFSKNIDVQKLLPATLHPLCHWQQDKRISTDL